MRSKFASLEQVSQTVACAKCCNGRCRHFFTGLSSLANPLAWEHNRAGNPNNVRWNTPAQKSEWGAAVWCGYRFDNSAICSFQVWPYVPKGKTLTLIFPSKVTCKEGIPFHSVSMKSWHHGLQTLDMIARATTAAAVYCRTVSINKKNPIPHSS